jgi:Demerecviridae nicking endonuclease
MSKLERIPLKYVRDRAKSRYVKDKNCYICGTETNLDFHHFLTLDILFDNWLQTNKIIISSTDDIFHVREDFIATHEYELFEYAITLCKKCHQRLHVVYGQRPSLLTAPKQVRWVDKQREKNGWANNS